MASFAAMSVLNCVFALVMFPAAFLYFMRGGSVIVDWEVISVGGVSGYASGVADSTSLLFSFTVTFIAAWVYVFSLGYMRGELSKHRFGIVLFLFIVCMNLLVFSPNLVSLLLGWDGLGLTSFLLVVYYQSAYSIGAGMITALTNRVGDVMIILSIVLLSQWGEWHMFAMVHSLFCCWLIVVAAMTKSAQFPFCSWLPMAMAAPTPVSALVHSSTLVTAGVYLLVRFYPVLSFSWALHGWLLFVGSLTMFLAGLAAFAEFDFKKVVAYSTLSQLGVMIVSLGLGLPGLALFHLLAHAMFKALLFLCVGVVIDYHGHAQDLRSMGNLSKGLPVVQVGLLTADMSLCGVPFLSGFYSKDLILECGMMGDVMWVFLIFLGVATFFTSSYSVRSAKMSQFGVALQSAVVGLSGGSGRYSVAIGVLTFMAVWWGAGLNWLLVPMAESVTVTEWVGFLPLVFIAGGAAYAWSGIVYEVAWKVSLWLELCKKWVGSRGIVSYCLESFGSLWFLGVFSSQHVITKPLGLGYSFLSLVDQGWLELSVSQGASLSVRVALVHVQTLNSNLFTTCLFLGAHVLALLVMSAV